MANDEDTVECPRCHGAGGWSHLGAEKQCPNCGGTGQVSKP